MQWVPLAPSVYWEVMVDDISLGGESLGFCGVPSATAGCRVAVDTGTSLFTGPGGPASQKNNPTAPRLARRPLSRT